MRYMLDALEAKLSKGVEHLDAAQQRSARLCRLPARNLAADLVRSAGAAEQGDLPSHRGAGHPPRSDRLAWSARCWSSRTTSKPELSESETDDSVLLTELTA